MVKAVLAVAALGDGWSDCRSRTLLVLPRWLAQRATRRRALMALRFLWNRCMSTLSTDPGSERLVDID